jgi:hypothetical protein
MPPWPEVMPSRFARHSRKFGGKASMRRAVLSAVVIANFAGAGLAQDAIDPVKAAAFDMKMFGRSPGDKAYACFVRRYDADHMARHPKQKVAAMRLLVSAEIPEGEKTLGYSFRLGVNYRHRAGDFDSSGYCAHALAEAGGHEIRFSCAVDCEGGGINVALSRDDRSAIVRLERIAVWQNGKQDEDAGEALVAGADDRIFRLDRAAADECASLVTDRKELAALRHK